MAVVNLPGMGDPAQPAQPVLPALPAQMSGLGAGGYTGPQQSLPQSGPAPGPGPTWATSQGSAAASTTIPPNSQQAMGAAAPQAAPTALGASGNILSQLAGSSDPALFAQQFNTLMDQRQLIAKPKGVDGRGFQIPSKDQQKYIKGWLDQRVQYLTAPAEMGGTSMTPYQARVQAVTEARQTFNIDPRYLAAWGQAAGPGEASFTSEKEATGESGGVKLGTKGSSVEFGPERAKKITPDKIAEILDRPEFAAAMSAAEQYKGQAAGVANAKDFAKWFVEGAAKRRMDKYQADVQAYNAAKEQAKTDAAITVPPKPASVGMTQARQDAYDMFANQAHILSVAAALSQLY